MDDQLYWNGYSGNPGYMKRIRNGTIKYLGYEPLYVASIDYADYTGKYPPYTFERAGREVYLMTRNAVGNITYIGSRNPNVDLLEDQRPYFEKGFSQAHSLLKDDGIIDKVVTTPPIGKERQKLLDAQAVVAKQLKQMWGTVYGQPFFHLDVPTKGKFDGKTELVLTKVPRGSYGPQKGDSIMCGTGGTYVFDLELLAKCKQAGLVIYGKAPKKGKTNLLVKVAGQKIAYVADAFKDDKPVALAIPANLVSSRMSIDIAYFLGDSYDETCFDSSITVERLELRIK